MKLVVSGSWSENLDWEFYLNDQLPNPGLCTAVGCIAIVENRNTVLLALNQRGWELIGGHIEAGETPEEAMLREAQEEGGFVPQSLELFGHYKISAKEKNEHDQKEGYYPFPISYIPYYIARTNGPTIKPTGEEIIEAHEFPFSELSVLSSTDKQIALAGIKIYMNKP